MVFDSPFSVLHSPFEAICETSTILYSTSTTYRQASISTQTLWVSSPKAKTDLLPLFVLAGILLFSLPHGEQRAMSITPSQWTGPNLTLVSPVSRRRVYPSAIHFIR